MAMISYPNGKPEESKDVNVIYLVLGELKYYEDEEPEKIWEIITDRKVLYDYLVTNYQWLDFDRTKIYASSKELEKEYMVDLSKEGVSAYETIKLLQNIFTEDSFDIDDVLDENIYV